MCHNDAVIIYVKNCWRPFCCFHGEKEELTHKLLVFLGNLYSYRTRIIVNGCCWNICKLVPDSYSYLYQCECGLRPGQYASLFSVFICENLNGKKW